MWWTPVSSRRPSDRCLKIHRPSGKSVSVLVRGNRSPALVVHNSRLTARRARVENHAFNSNVQLEHRAALRSWIFDPRLAYKAIAIFLQAAASASVFPVQPTVRAFRQGDMIGAKTRAAARSDPLPSECQTMLLNVAFDVTAWSFIAWPFLSPC